MLTARGWTFAGLGRNTAWGDSGTFVPSDEGGLSYCRSLTPPAGAARLACTQFDATSRVWRRDQVSGPARPDLLGPVLTKVAGPPQVRASQMWSNPSRVSRRFSTHSSGSKAG